MALKDNFETQSQRVTRAVVRLCPSCAVEFDNSKAPHGIRFRIMDGGTNLTSAYPEYLVSEVADWTEEKLNQIIESVTAGKVRAPR